ncbi:SPOR domain-containing protein [Fictibacillus fluitans]|uniref:SPOR domain-containing protein n=1 Tax=Fictibacillus fluitans TaxID=3058422 RepID=A0ABT8HZL7_9BACL|nr:SPOR domain-containing protein [Fictibacillus sp. NE201]MDN4526230.1 SPOR domain-containing protein [Fictibacillus sp. NE201]
MKEQKPVTVLINGKVTSCKEGKSEQQATTKEIAAAVYTEERSAWEIIDGEESGKVLDFKKVISPVPRPSALKKLGNKRRMFLIRRNRSTNPFSKPWMTAAIAAIVTGCTFGAIILMLFTGESASTEAQILSARQAKLSSTASAPATIGSVPLNFHAVQNGLFSTEKKAEEVSSKLKEKGYAAAVYKQGTNFSVLIGMGNKKEQVKSLADAYQLQGVEVWQKQLDASYSNLKIAQKMDEPFIVNGKILLQNVITLSQVPELSKKAKASIKQDYEGWKEYGDKQDEKWPSKQRKAAKAYELQISAALDRLSGTRSKEVDWPLQQAVLDSFISYTKLLDTLK